MLGFAVILLFVTVALFAPLISPFDPIAQSYTQIRHPPSDLHWFGTDELGRDLLARIIYGARADRKSVV